MAEHRSTQLLSQLAAQLQHSGLRQDRSTSPQHVSPGKLRSEPDEAPQQEYNTAALSTLVSAAFLGDVGGSGH